MLLLWKIVVGFLNRVSNPIVTIVSQPSYDYINTFRFDVVHVALDHPQLERIEFHMILGIAEG
jgi:hypothetical protein